MRRGGLRTRPRPPRRDLDGGPLHRSEDVVGRAHTPRTRTGSPMVPKRVGERRIAADLMGPPPRLPASDRRTRAQADRAFAPALRAYAPHVSFVLLVRYPKVLSRGLSQEHSSGMPTRISAVFGLRQQANQDRTDTATPSFSGYGRDERQWKRFKRKLRGIEGGERYYAKRAIKGSIWRRRRTTPRSRPFI